MALEALEIEGDGVGEIDADSVGLALVGFADSTVTDLEDLIVGFDDALGEEKSDGEFGVVAGRSHRDGDGVVDSAAPDRIADADLEGLFNGEEVLDIFTRRGPRRDPLDGGSRMGRIGFHQRILSEKFF